MPNIQEQIRFIPEHVAGATATALGTGGFVVQTITQWGSLAVMLGNLILVIGGCYLMWHKIIDRHLRNRRKGDDIDG